MSDQDKLASAAQKLGVAMSDFGKLSRATVLAGDAMATLGDVMADALETEIAELPRWRWFKRRILSWELRHYRRKPQRDTYHTVTELTSEQRQSVLIDATRGLGIELTGVAKVEPDNTTPIRSAVGRLLSKTH